MPCAHAFFVNYYVADEISTRNQLTAKALLKAFNHAASAAPENKNEELGMLLHHMDGVIYPSSYFKPDKDALLANYNEKPDIHHVRKSVKNKTNIAYSQIISNTCDPENEDIQDMILNEQNVFVSKILQIGSGDVVNTSIVCMKLVDHLRHRIKDPKLLPLEVRISVLRVFKLMLTNEREKGNDDLIAAQKRQLQFGVHKLIIDVFSEAGNTVSAYDRAVLELGSELLEEGDSEMVQNAMIDHCRANDSSFFVKVRAVIKRTADVLNARSDENVESEEVIYRICVVCAVLRILRILRITRSICFPSSSSFFHDARQIKQQQLSSHHHHL